MSVVIISCGQAGATPAGPSPTGATDTAIASDAAPSAAPVPGASTGAASTEPSGPPGSPADPALGALPTRIVIDGLGIDLPIVSGDLIVAGNPPDYPLCDVAQFLTTYRYPGRPGTTTWVYAHARDGMFLPLLKASEIAGGKKLIGLMAALYTDAGDRYTYRITEVMRHATDRSAAADVPGDEGRLVLQTSEGPKGTVPKLQVVATLVKVARADLKASVPSAKPRGCFIP
ncbi:MAG: hypothetical protein ABIQ58_10650 [Candidatus Limnocylindrales bacterium]